MTNATREKIYLEFGEMVEQRSMLDQDLVAEFQNPTDTSSYADREELLQRAEELVEKERNFLRKWNLQLDKRERLLR
jgi:flagellar biosynthesis chaperone FliJ